MISTIEIGKWSFKVPGIPNFILPDGMKEGIAIEKFSDEELAEIGKAWTENLIVRANTKRGLK